MVTPYEAAAAVVDPELRVVTIAELGILRDVKTVEGKVRVTITPTYSGCPAMDAIRSDIVAALEKAGYDRAEVVTKLSPAWSTDMITESGREALARNGIAPPGTDECPHCASPKTLQISRYGSTPCQALFKCQGCHEPFPLVKTL
ncbi:MAG TPA: 1,2-phenylacetyl-CoA epoxidase subunit PaaD [Candidatus Limnocylindrales bacterium]|nr:1,2-phenylacetyl-CoA epoxidase subunit PaaD [Candidatus Limnocylindrales bacterium]